MYVAGAHHLQLVQNTFSKDPHGLREHDVAPMVIVSFRIQLESCYNL